MTEIAIMWNILSKRGSSESKIAPIMKGGYHTAPLQFLGTCTALGPIIHNKEFPTFINRSNPSAHSLQNNQKMDRPQEVNSSPQKAEIKTKNNPVANTKGCNSKKKKKKRRRKGKKNKNQSQVCGEMVEKPIGGCSRQRLLSTESEDSFVVFFDEALSGHDRISELSEDETVTTEDFDSSDSIIPIKKVRFADDSELCQVHPMIMWSYAYQAARKGPWEEYARDRDRFHKRVVNTEARIGHVFNAEHRARIYQERFA